MPSGRAEAGLLMEAPLTEQAVRRIVRAAFQGAPGPWRMRLALKEMERIRDEMVEEVMNEMARHYGVETTGE